MNIKTHIPTPADLFRGTSQWLREHPKSRYILAFFLICSICYIINQGIAWADTEQEPSAQMLFLPLGGITDTDGVPAWRYFDLPMDPGNAGYVFRGARHAIASLFWIPYAAFILLLVSLVDWLVSFEWLSWIAAPFQTIATGLSDVLDAWMLIPLGISISALWIGIGFLRGRTGAATVEFIMVALVLGFIASPWTQPFDILAGEGTSADSNQGLIAKAGDIGAEAGALTINQDAEGDDLSLASSVIDITLRRPMLTMSFGSPLEGECAESWNTNAAADSGNDAEDIRKEVIKCDDAVADANQTSSYMWVGTYVFAVLSSVGVLLLLALFTVFLIWQVVQAFIASIVTIARAYFAMFPGNSRTAWLESLFQVITSGVLIGVYVFAITIYMYLFGFIMNMVPPLFMQVGSIIMGIVIVVVAVTFWKMKRSGDSISKRVARALSKNGLSKDVGERQPSKMGMGSVLARTAEFYQRSRMLRAGTKVATAAATGGAGVAAASTVGKSMAAKTGQKMMQQSLPPAQPVNQLPAAPSQQQLAPVPNVQRELPPAAPPADARSVQSGPLPPAPGDSSQGAIASGHHRGQVEVGPEYLPSQHEPKTPPAKGPKTDANHIPAGRYGNTYVHKNGQISSPMTIDEHGKPVKNVPSDDKMQRAYKDNGAWVTTEAAEPTPTAMRTRYNQSTENQR